METFKVPATITKISTMRDRCLRLQVDTQELGEESAKVFGLYDTLGVFLFSKSDITNDDLADLPEVKSQGISQSKRLRNVLYRLWEQSLGGQSGRVTFEEYYENMMDKIIEYYKDKI